MKKRNYIWKIVVAIATVITLVVFFTGRESLCELLCGKVENDSNSNTTQIEGPVGVIVNDNATVETINQQIDGENNTQYNINVK